jgi:hypothetical protein
MTQMIQQSTTQDAVATYLEGLRSLDAERALSRFSLDAVVHYPGQPPMSPDAFRASLSPKSSPRSRAWSSRHATCSRLIMASEHGGRSQPRHMQATGDVRRHRQLADRHRRLDHRDRRVLRPIAADGGARRLETRSR